MTPDNDVFQIPERKPHPVEATESMFTIPWPPKAQITEFLQDAKSVQVMYAILEAMS